MSAAISPITQDAISKRRGRVTPNYELVHMCPECNLSSYCPDRFAKPSCGPSDFYQEKGWGPYSYTCLPCMAKFSPEDRAIWYEAHGVE